MNDDTQSTRRSLLVLALIVHMLLAGCVLAGILYSECGS